MFDPKIKVDWENKGLIVETQHNHFYGDKSQEIGIKSISNNNLPPKPYIDFVWREEDVEYISLVIDARNIHILSIEWVGWLWKTSLAYFVTKKLLEKQKVSYAIWCSAKNKDIYEKVESIQQFLFDLDSFLNLSLWVFWVNIHGLSTEQKKEELKSCIREKWKTLFILDNFESIKDQELIDFIKSFVTFSWNFFFLFTSRIRAWLMDTPYKIKWMSEEELLKITHKYQEHYNFKWKLLKEETLLDLCKKAQGNPLVVRTCLIRMQSVKQEEVLRLLDHKDSLLYTDLSEYLYLEIFNELSSEGKLLLQILKKIGDNINDSDIALLQSIFSPKNLDDIFRELSQSGLLIESFDVSKSHNISEIHSDSFLKNFLQKRLEDDTNLQKEVSDIYVQYQVTKSQKDLTNPKYKHEADELWAADDNQVSCYANCCHFLHRITQINLRECSESEKNETFVIWEDFLKKAENYSNDFWYLHYCWWFFYLKNWNYAKAITFFEKIIESYNGWKIEDKKYSFITNYMEALCRSKDWPKAYNFFLTNCSSFKWIAATWWRRSILRSLSTLKKFVWRKEQQDIQVFLDEFSKRWNIPLETLFLSNHTI